MSEREAYVEAVSELLLESFSPLNVQMREHLFPALGRVCLPRAAIR